MKRVKLQPPAELTGMDSLTIDPHTMQVQAKAGHSDLKNQDDSDDGEFINEDPAVIQREREIYDKVIGEETGNDRFVSMNCITNGGMGILYTCVEQDLQRTVAMKVVIPQRKLENGILESFLREAQLTSQLQHPNIIPIYRMGFEPEIGVYYTMRFVEGESLLSILNKIAADSGTYREKYDHVRLLDIFRKVADAVAFAHSCSVIHRDIKPDNIMVGSFGDVLLLDWGLAKKLKSAGRQKVRIGGDAGGEVSTFMGHLLKGSPSYMSPEQAMGDEGSQDTCTDIFLLGATLYHMFTGKPPFRGKSIAEIIQKARACDFPALDQRAFKDAKIPPAIVKIISRAMQAKADHRYHTVEDMIRDIEDLVHGKMDFHMGTYKAGELLIKQGTIGNELYYILEGEVVVYSEGRLGMVKELERIGPGEIVGELALISETARQASVKAVSETKVLILSKQLFNTNLDKMPPWVAKLIRCLAGRLLTANAHNKDLHLRPSFLPW